MSSDEDTNLWGGWENGPSTVEASSLPARVPICNGKGEAVLEVGHLTNVDVNCMTDMANGVAAFPDDPTQMPVAQLPPASGRSKKPRRGRVVLVDEDGSGSVKAVPLNDKQDIEIVKAIAGGKYNQAVFLKAMRSAADPKDAISQLADEGLRAKFQKAGNIIFSADTVAALKPPRKRPAPKAKKDDPPPAAAAAASPPPAKKRKAAAPAPEPVATAAAPLAPEPAAKKIRVTVSADVGSMSEFIALFTP